MNLEAYAIKKSLPRLVIAAVMIQFSFVLCGLIIDLGNIIADGMSDFIQSVAQVSSGTSGVDGLVTKMVEVFIGAITLAFVPTGLAQVGIVLIITAIIAIFFAVLSVMVTLTVRKLILTILIVLSPLAFLAMVLPSTEKLFSLWYKNFIRLIMMYPIVVLLFSAAPLAQALTGTGGNPTDFSGGLNSLLAAAFPIIACFMVPMSYKWGGQFMGAAAGFTTKAVGAAGSRARGGWQNSNAAQNLNLNRQERRERRQRNDYNGDNGALRQRMARARTGDFLGNGRRATFSWRNGVQTEHSPELTRRRWEREKELEEQRQATDNRLLRPKFDTDMKNLEKSGNVHHAQQHAAEEIAQINQELDPIKADLRHDTKMDNILEANALPKLKSDAAQAKKKAEQAQNAPLQAAKNKKAMAGLAKDGNLRLARSEAKIAEEEVKNATNADIIGMEEEKKMRELGNEGYVPYRERKHKEEMLAMDIDESRKVAVQGHEARVQGLMSELEPDAGVTSPNGAQRFKLTSEAEQRRIRGIQTQERDAQVKRLTEIEESGTGGVASVSASALDAARKARLANDLPGARLQLEQATAAIAAQLKAKGYHDPVKTRMLEQEYAALASSPQATPEDQGGAYRAMDYISNQNWSAMKGGDPATAWTRGAGRLVPELDQQGKQVYNSAGLPKYTKTIKTSDDQQLTGRLERWSAKELAELTRGGMSGLMDTTIERVDPQGNVTGKESAFEYLLKENDKLFKRVNAQDFSKIEAPVVEAIRDYGRTHNDQELAQFGVNFEN